MQTTLTGNLLEFLSPLRLAGPVFDKELRVASRRRRLYVLRFVYVGLLAMLVLSAWSMVARSAGAGGAVVRVSRLGELGKQIVMAIVWLQFISGQVLAAVLLSDAIGSEIRQRTLDSLLVTPVRAFQIVIGKLASKLLQAASLLAISLPMLAVVRVFGGVPWDFVVAGLCLTASATVFSGMLSLTSSVFSRRPYDGVLWVVLWYFVIWVALPIVLTGLSAGGYVSGAGISFWMRLTNPLVTMVELTQGMAGRSGGVYGSLFWLWTCLILLALSMVLLAWSTRRVRRAAVSTTSVRISEEAQDASSHGGELRGRRAIRPVTGSPIVWKERCTPLFKGTGRGVSIAAFLLVALIVTGLGILAVLGGPMYVILFPLVQALQLIFVIDLAVGAAGAIAKEREARTWPILLMTPIDDGEIIKGKAIGVFRRNLPLLLSLVVLYPLMVCVGSLGMRTSPHSGQAAILPLLSLGSATLFLLGVGLYFSARLKTTTAAVISTLAAYFLSKFFFCGLLSPLFAMSTGMMGAMGGRGGSAVSWLVWMALAPAAVYGGLGLLFMRLAVPWVRRGNF
jgi:ABC-type transport system involved in multi-copper enzyme maturation permease subunit